MTETQSKTWQKSLQAYAAACRYLVGGVNSPVRAFGGVDSSPLFISAAKGSKIYDIDGNEYIDYVCSWGPMILGHAHPGVLGAVRTAAEKGTSFGAPTLAETALAEKIVGSFDSIEKVRLVNSGTEAVMTAVRLARGFTKRDLIIKMAGCYHGHSDSLLVAGGSGLAEGAASAWSPNAKKGVGGQPSSAGVPAGIAGLTIVVPFNDIDAVKSVFAAHGNTIAAVLVEPVAANMGVVPPVPGYLQALRELCDAYGSVLIFDEVITGFRVAAGGAQELFGINADLTCLGKIIGGGLPAAALGGRADIMALLAPTGPVYQAGTLSGNPLATAAANATIDVLTKNDCYSKLEASAGLLQAGLAEAAKNAGIPVTINRVGSIMSCFFTDGTVRNFDDVRATNIPRFKMFFAEMLRQGIYLAPSAFEAMFISLAHTKADIKVTIEAAESSFGRIRNKK